MSGIKITVLLTTYKRPDYLKLAIKSVLNQDFDSFELLVMDDASGDETEKVVKSFKDKRIRHVKNAKNLGFPPTFKKGVMMSRGKYIFLLSDDDFILKKTTFSNVYKKMEKFKAGFAELALIFYDENYLQPSSLSPPGLKGEIFYAGGKDILLDIMLWHTGFASGHIYKRDLIRLSDLENGVWFSHVKPIYSIVQNKGALYLGDDYIVGRISKTGNISYLNMSVNGEFHMEKMFNMFKFFDKDKKHLDLFMKQHLESGLIKNFPGIKYYTSNKNILEMAKRALILKPEYKKNPLFWSYLSFALIAPKPLLSLIRSYMHQKNQNALAEYLKLISYEKNIRRAIG